MKKKFLLVSIMIMLGLLAFFTISVSAETDGIYTYSISNGKATITDCDESANGRIMIPDYLGGYPVISIGEDAFYNCGNITSVTISDNVTSIGNYAFDECTRLTSVTIGKGVSSIGKRVFDNCTKLSIVNIKDVASWCNVDLYDDNVTSSNIGLYINGNAITELIIPNGVTRIKSNVFANCFDLTSVIIPDSVTHIGQCAFYNCSNLTSITIPDTVTTIGKGAFSYTKYDSDNWENGALYIGNHLINTSKVATGELNIKNGTITIADGAFFTSKFTSVIIPSSVKNIGYGAFESCSNLRTVNYTSDQESWNTISIESGNFYLKNATINFNYASSVKLSYNANGGENPPQTAECIIGIPVTIPITTPLREGYKFLGWSTSSSDVIAEYQPNDTITVGTNDITLYAVWKLIPYTKTQSLNGIFLVTPTGVENGNRVIFVCYNGDRMVYVNPYVYAGESTIPFTTSETYDKVKVMVWENLETCVPLCEAENVPLN